MSEPWKPRTIRMVQWEGERCKAGDTLISLRRRYQVLSVQDKPECPFKVFCMVIPPDAEATGKSFRIYSAPRKRLRNKVGLR